MSSLFTKIISGEVNSHKIAENDYAYAFLDINPLHEGHCLVVPKKEVDYIFDVPEKDYNELWAFAKKISHALGKAISCKRVGIAVLGLEVPHAHIHLIPINEVKDIDFSRPKLQFSDQELEATAEKIRKEL